MTYEVMGGPLDGKRVARPAEGSEFYGKVLDDEGTLALYRWDPGRSQWRYIGTGTGIFSQNDLRAFIHKHSGN